LFPFAFVSTTGSGLAVLGEYCTHGANPDSNPPLAREAAHVAEAEIEDDDCEVVVLVLKVVELGNDTTLDVLVAWEVEAVLVACEIKAVAFACLTGGAVG
jgi:hypothetical protein